MLLAFLRPSAWSSVDTGQQIFNERVRTLEVKPQGASFAAPGLAEMILDDEGSAIEIEFDILSEDRQYLRYELVHCNANWQPSSLAYIEYLDGFNEGTVDNYAFSQATVVHYVHYSLVLPNDQTRITASGNYLLKIYDEDDGPDHPLLQCRFVVSENTARVAAGIRGRTDVDYNRAHQQLELEVDVERSNVRDLFNDITIVVTQNGRTDNAVMLDKPMRVSGQRLIYEHQPALIFAGGNEYRRFETISTTYPGMSVEEIVWQNPYYHFVLATDQSRPNDSYHYDQTLSGAFLVREYNSDDGDTEADYGVVHFSLDYPETPGFHIFLDGDFVQRRFSPESLMTFNRATGRYEHAALLKQGAYSYQYLAVPTGKAGAGRTDVIEGNHYETRNRYNIYVYHRRPGERYDRLIGTYTILPR